MDREQKLKKTYFEVFVFSVIICFSPIPKAIVFFLPFVSIVWFFKRNPLKYSFARVLFISLLFILYLLFYLALNNGAFFIINFIISILFYSSFFFFYIAKSPVITDFVFFNKKYIPFIKWVLIIESIFGIFQVFLAGEGVDVSSGDYVQGTINILSFVNHQNGFNNVFFVINMTSLLIIYSVMAVKKSWFVILIGWCSIVLASTVHLSLALIVAIFATYLSLNIIKAVKILIPIALFFLILYSFFPKNFSSLGSYKEQITKSKNLKVISTKTTFNTLLDSPKDFFFGYGLGQYSSRAALVSSGSYFYNKNQKSFSKPLGLKNESAAYAENLKSNWTASITDEGYGFSVMNKPVYSILSLISESGIVLFSFMILGFSLFINKMGIRYRRGKEKIEKAQNIVVLVISFFLLMISFFENYLEMAQAIFPSLILLKVLSPKNKHHINEDTPS